MEIMGINISDTTMFKTLESGITENSERHRWKNEVLRYNSWQEMTDDLIINGLMTVPRHKSETQQELKVPNTKKNDKPHPTTTTTCFVCKQEGHRAQQCPKKCSQCNHHSLRGICTRCTNTSRRKDHKVRNL